MAGLEELRVAQRVREQRFSKSFRPTQPRALPSVSANPETTTEMWAVVARAAADHRRIVDAGDEVFYGDWSLRRSDEAHARSGVTQAIRRALDAGVAEQELVDALMSGDPSCDFLGALDLLEAPRRQDDAMQRLTEEIVRDLFGDDD